MRVHGNIPALLRGGLLFLLAAAAIEAAPYQDRVTHLPGWDGPLPSTWYSGYLTYRLPCMGNRTIHTHYVYAEAQPQSDDATAEGGPPTSTEKTARRAEAGRDEGKTEDGGDGTGDEGDDGGGGAPLIFWSNGGPGASSLFGLLTELGPLLLNDDSLRAESYQRTGIPALLPNKSSWNRLGSLLVFDAPAPVGFSYCDDAVDGDGLSCGGWDDDSSAWNNYHALLAFYGKFPELRTRPLYLTGESYAGVYVPSFARKILEHNDAVVAARKGGRRVEGLRATAPDSGGTGAGDIIPLRGFAVGDACAGTDVNCGAWFQAPWFGLQFLSGHGQISLKMHREVVRICGREALMIGGDALGDECKAELLKVLSEAGGFYVYSLYDDCTYRNGILRKQRWNVSAATATRRSGAAAEIGVAAGGALNDYACGGGPVMERYVRIPSVRMALHVPLRSNFFDGDNGVGFNYTMTERNLMPFYREVASGRYDSAYGHPRVLVYNGDTDPSINSFVAENWTSHLGLEEAEPWRPWTIDRCRRMGGYVTRYEGALDFLTIRGAGHMVPTYKPEAAFAFLEAWIKDEPYPEFDAKCEHP